MDIFRKIADRKISEAMADGMFENLPGKGRPLELDDDVFVPQDLRIAYKVLKNEGFLPPELEAGNEIINLRSLIDTLDDDKERLKKLRELNFRIMKLNMMRKTPLYLGNLLGMSRSRPEYESLIIEKAVL